MPFPVPNFPGVGPIGGFYVVDGATGSNNAAAVTGDEMLFVGGPVLYSILAELRVMNIFLKAIANVPDDLQQLRNDAVADMATLYAAPQSTPVPSS